MLRRLLNFCLVWLDYILRRGIPFKPKLWDAAIHFDVHKHCKVRIRHGL